MGSSPAYRAMAEALGAAMAARGIDLVYGGGKLGLMGVVADAVLAGGGRVHGVIPAMLEAHEVAHRGCTELHVVQTMHERKAKMADLADAFVALPGGIGTLDEMFEVWTWNALGFHAKPMLLLDVDGYWKELEAMIATMERCGFASPARAAMLERRDTVEDTLDLLALRVSEAEVKVVW